MKVLSCGIIPYKVIDGTFYFFVGHPGGMRREYWAFMKGRMEDTDKDCQACAVREFKEETGVDVDYNQLVFLGETTQNSQKRVRAYSIYKDDIDPDKCFSNLCLMGWPEIDKYRWIAWEELKTITNPHHHQFYETIINNHKDGSC